MVDDVSAMANRMNLKRRDVFSSVYTYLDTFDLTSEEQDTVSQAKLIFPFEKIDGIDYLRSVKEVPPKEHFGSLLRAETEITDSQYSLFREVWRILKPENLLFMLVFYVNLDTAFLGCCINWYFEEIFRVTECHPLYYKTISALSLATALFHSTDPVQKGRLLRLQLLPEHIYEKFKNLLIGGLSSIFSHFTKWNYGTDFGSENVTYGTYIDINGD